MALSTEQHEAAFMAIQAKRYVRQAAGWEPQSHRVVALARSLGLGEWTEADQRALNDILDRFPSYEGLLNALLAKHYSMRPQRLAAASTPDDGVLRRQLDGFVLQLMPTALGEVLTVTGTGADDLKSLVLSPDGEPSLFVVFDQVADNTAQSLLGRQGAAVRQALESSETSVGLLS